MDDQQNGQVLQMVTDQRGDFFFQVPAVRLHPVVFAALGLPDLTLATVHCAATGKTALAWATANGGGDWDGCPTPWHRSAQLSAAAWRALVSDGPPRSGEQVRITFPICRFAVRPARVERLLAGDEICLHQEDALKFGIAGSAIVNYCGIPGAFRVVLSDDERDRGFARLSYQSRMLLGVPQRRFELLPEIHVACLPRSARSGPLLLEEPRWEGGPSPYWRGLRKLGGWIEQAATAVLRAPELAFRTIDALPGEDHARTVRLAPEFFPLLGIQPGQQVYVTWGPRNHVIATALIKENYDKGPDQWAATDRVGHHSGEARVIPKFARLRVGAEIRGGLGIPRTAVVTIRRRVSSLMLAKLNELILPVTGLFISLSAGAKLKVWEVTAAAIVILILLLTPLRVRRTPRGRIP